VLPNVPGFLKSTHLLSGPDGFFDAIYVYAWFTGFLIAGGIYLVGMKAKTSSSVTSSSSS
jgi:cytosine/uracil/thiamine/allantoin permease